MLNVLIDFGNSYLTVLLVDSCKSYFPLRIMLGFVTPFQCLYQCAYPCHLLFSLASKGEQSLTINVLLFIKFDFNWNDNWNMLLLVIYTVIYAITCISSPVTSDTIICYLYWWYMPVILLSYLLSLCKFPVSIEFTMGWNDTYPDDL